MSDEYAKAVHPAVRVVARLARAPRPVPVEKMSAERDLPPSPVGATDTIVIAGSPRTGSNLLCYSLAAAGFGVGDEYWSERHLWGGYVRWGVPRPTWRALAGQARRAIRRDARWWLHHRVTTEQFLAYHEQVVRHRTSQNGVFAIKIFIDDYRRAELRNGVLPPDVLPGRLHWVHLSRSDTLAQAISHHRATATGSWLDVHGEGTPPFDPGAVGHAELEAIRSWRDRFERDEAGWAAEFDRLGVEPIRVDYEQLDTDLVGVLRAIVAPLGGEIDDDLQPVTARQSDEANAEVRRRFLDVYPDGES